jgi:hypothetical protein
MNDHHDITHDIAIVGAGAAGLTAGIAAGQHAHSAGSPLRILLIDAARHTGIKILAAGGGRCNVTHDPVLPEDFNGPRNIIRNVLAGFDARATIAWFESLGVPLKTEPTGKIFPVSDSARTVLDALLSRCAHLGATILQQSRIREITVDSPSEEAAPARLFTLRHEQGTVRAHRVILCTGGKSMGSTGSTGQGWDLARQLGHTVTDVYPALVPLILDETLFHADVTGLSHEAELSTFVDGKRIDRRTGSLLWTHFGISGPVVLDVSRHWAAARLAGRQVEIRCNFLPGESFEQVEQWLTEQGRSPHRLVDSVLASRLPRRLAERLARFCGITNDVRAGRLRREDRRQLVHVLTELPLPVAGNRGWDLAEVTAGGVPLQEIDYRTMESRKCPGLYLAGEMLDVDGPVGGYNLQWAWSTGMIAGRAAAKGLP